MNKSINIPIQIKTEFFFDTIHALQIAPGKSVNFTFFNEDNFHKESKVRVRYAGPRAGGPCQVQCKPPLIVRRYGQVTHQLQYLVSIKNIKYYLYD